MWEVLTLIILGVGSYFLYKRVNLGQSSKPIDIEVPDIEDEPQKDDASEIITKNDDVMLEDAQDLFAEADFRAAEKIAIEVIKNDHKNAKAYVLLGNIFYKEENLQEAIAAFKKASELDPEDDISFNNLGLAYFKLEDFENAMNCFEKSTKINPNIPSRFINLALASKKNKRPREAVKALERLTSLEDPSNIAHLKMLAETYEEVGQIEKSIKIYTQVLVLDPEDSFVKRKLARY